MGGVGKHGVVTEKERQAFLQGLFEEVDEARRKISQMPRLRPKLRGVGDLNPTADLEALYQRYLTERGLEDVIPEEVATRVKRRRLDVMWKEKNVAAGGTLR